MRCGKRLFLPLAIAAFQLSSLFSQSPERKIYSLISIKDYREACRQAETLVQHTPSSQAAWTAYIEALAKNKEEAKLLSVYKKYRSLFPDSLNREVLETVAWTVIEKAHASSSPLIRVYACLGAFMGQDAKSIAVLKAAASDANPQIRALFAKLASGFRDASLQDEVMKMLEKEKHPQVRVEVIKAVGKMKIKAAETHLIELLVGKQSLDEERAAAIEALVNLFDKGKKEQIKQLAKSSRAELRELSCKVLLHTFDYENLDLIIPLLEDCSSDVRCSSVQTLGVLKVKESRKKEVLSSLEHHLKDPDPFTAISASWALTIYGKELFFHSFQDWLFHPNRDIRHFASGALAATGKYGVDLMKQVLQKSQDPYVKANLAIGLIGQRKEMDLSKKELSLFVEKNAERIMQQERGEISYITKSDVRFSLTLPGKPDLVDQITRLELINTLAVAGDEHAISAARNFLKEKGWGVTTLAAALLLSEGDGSAYEVVEELSNDQDRKIRVQAALILALLGKDENAASFLQEAYPESERVVKERILEGIGQIGSENSIPFLVEALYEPFQSLRVIAASSLLNCLYH